MVNMPSMELRAYLDEKNIAPAAFAATLGVSAAALYRYMARERLPRRDVMAKITEKTAGKVQPNDFFSARAAA